MGPCTEAGKIAHYAARNVPVFYFKLITKWIKSTEIQTMNSEHANILLPFVFLHLDNNIHILQLLNFDSQHVVKQLDDDNEISLNQLFLLHTCCINEGEMYTRRLVFEKVI